MTPGELIDGVGIGLKVPTVTVGAHYRVLREAGLVTKGGRGKSAPTSTPLDGARLLIALLFSDTGVDSARAVEKFGRLIPVKLMDFEGRFEFGNAVSKGFLETDLEAILLDPEAWMASVGAKEGQSLSIAASARKTEATIIANNLVMTYGVFAKTFYQPADPNIHIGMIVERKISECEIQPIANLFS